MLATEPHARASFPKYRAPGLALIKDVGGRDVGACGSRSKGATINHWRNSTVVSHKRQIAPSTFGAGSSARRPFGATRRSRYMQSQYNTMVGGARMIYDYPHPAPEWSGIFEAGVCARESLPMKRDAGSGRPLLIAAMELLTDAPAQIIISAFRASAGDPRERATTAHYQRLIWRDLRPSLQNGRLVALGFVDGAEELQAIPPHSYSKRCGNDR